MNGRFRKASALFATVALVTGGLIAALAAPASASSPTGCEGGCTLGSVGSGATAGGSYTLGQEFATTDIGAVNGYYFNDGTGGGHNQNNPETLWSGWGASATPIETVGTSCNEYSVTLGYCYGYFGVQPPGQYMISYSSTGFYLQDTGAVPAQSAGSPVDFTTPADGSVYSSSGAPSIGGYTFSVNAVFTSGPNAPTVTVTAASPTTAEGTYVGDSAGGAATMWARCTQSPSYDTGQDPVSTGANGPYTQGPTNIAENGQPVICTSQETANGIMSQIGSAEAYLPPPAPTIGAVTAAGPAEASVAFSGNGTNIGSYTATCTSSAGGSRSVSGTSSPIVVYGFSNLATQTLTCSVTETFTTAIGGPSAPSATATVGLVGSAVSGPGCIPSGTVAAPTQISAAAEAFPGAEVSWAPVDTDCLVGYLVTPSTGTAVLLAGHGTTTLVHGPFAFGTSVTFTVAAVTGSGVGPQSSSVSVTIGTPAAATSVTAVKVGKGALKVSFKPGRDNGAAITGFAVTCGPRTVESKGSPTTVKGLASNKSVTCTVKAANSRGLGARSARSARITP